MEPVINQSISRPDPELTRKLAQQGVATIHESMHKRGLLDPRLRPIAPGWSIGGAAVTSLNHPGDNLMVHAALSVCQPGDILVIATTVPCMCGMVGELLGRQAMARGVSGIVIDSGIRDLADLRDLGLPVWTTSVTAAGSVKSTPGWVNVPVVCGGITINPGDIVVADDDGVVAVPSEGASIVLEASEQRTAREAETRKRIADGELSFDMQNLRNYLRDKGVSTDLSSHKPFE